MNTPAYISTNPTTPDTRPNLPALFRQAIIDCDNEADAKRLLNALGDSTHRPKTECHSVHFYNTRRELIPTPPVYILVSSVFTNRAHVLGRAALVTLIKSPMRCLERPPQTLMAL